MQNNYEVLKMFLEELNVTSDYILTIDEFKENGKFDINTYDSTVQLIKDILVDMYNLSSEDVAKASEYYMSIGISFGREQKNILKEFFDYHDQNKAQELIENISTHCHKNTLFDDTESLYFPLNEFNKDHREEAVKLFKNSLKDANDKTKIKDYLLTIYTKLLNRETTHKTLLELFHENEIYYKNELSKSSVDELHSFCQNTVGPLPIATAAKIYQEKYIGLLDKDYQEKNSRVNYNRNSSLSLNVESYNHVHFVVNQEYFNRFSSLNNFYLNLCETIEKSYRVLKNYNAMTIKIENIYTSDRNLKWEIHSIIGIFSEKMIRYNENLSYYHPEEIVADFLRLDSEKITSLKNELKSYYKGKTTLENIDLDAYSVNKENIINMIEDYKNIEIGLSFADCFILKKQETFPNPSLPLVENNTELLYVFYKYRLDQRLVPCPSCGSLQISGNSFPDVWHRSFECKNIYCPDRSKSNRGKRYSVKTSYMQFGSMSKDPDDLISKDQISMWRKDIVSVFDENELLKMISKFFTFRGQSILLLNKNYTHRQLYNRDVTSLVIEGYEYSKKEYLTSRYYDIFYSPSSRLRKYVLVDKQETKDPSIKIDKEITLINGDSKSILYQVSKESVAAAVTSPPYYNAREYSNWSNFYLYLKDMYRIAKSVHFTLKPGAIYLYNIGDVLGNDNMIVKSNMGTRKMQLGAYTYFIFKEAGYEFLDNIIWDKGEVQSNRQMNDGKNTPHYQKPMNAYEHMYLFKKPGETKNINNSIWKNNIVKFSPVIKINSKGENTLGHTAPFPEDIPNYVIEAFTDINDILLDPFSGSLTTAIQASKHNRIGLGIEFSEEYADLSMKRASDLGIKINLIKKNKTE